MKQVTFKGVEYSVPEWAKWIAQDASGEICAYEHVPGLSARHNEYYSPGGKSLRVGYQEIASTLMKIV